MEEGTTFWGWAAQRGKDETLAKTTDASCAIKWADVRNYDKVSDTIFCNGTVNHLKCDGHRTHPNVRCKHGRPASAFSSDVLPTRTSESVFGNLLWFWGGKMVDDAGKQKQELAPENLYSLAIKKIGGRKKFVWGWKRDIRCPACVSKNELFSKWKSKKPAGKEEHTNAQTSVSDRVGQEKTAEFLMTEGCWIPYLLLASGGIRNFSIVINQKIYIKGKSESHTSFLLRDTFRVMFHSCF